MPHLSVADASRRLSSIRELLQTGRVQSAHEGIDILVDSIDAGVLAQIGEEITTTISSFFPKRRKAILQRIDARFFKDGNLIDPESRPAVVVKDAKEVTALEAPETKPPPNTSLQVVRDVASLDALETARNENATSEIRAVSLLRRADRSPSRLYEDTASEIRAFSEHISSGFRNLRTQNIFQSATYYRDFVGETAERATEVYSSSTREPLLDTIIDQFSYHALEIFSRGYAHRLSHKHVEEENYSILRSVNELQRFIEFPTDVYSARARWVHSGEEARRLRDICSAMIYGILSGYGETLLGEFNGWQSLPQYPRWWLHCAGFLTHRDLETLVLRFEPGEFRDGTADSLLPIARALDVLAGLEQPPFALPSQGEWGSNRLAITLVPLGRTQPLRNIEIHSYWSASSFQRSLEEPSNRGVAAIVVSLRPHLHEWLESHSALLENVVNTNAEDAGFEQQVDQILKLLRYHISLSVSGADARTPIRFNFAKDFPLHKPEPDRYYHVHRTSVLQLLQSFERQTGVRLWCSVRRSGKTTACFDLGNSTGEYPVVSQTCLTTVQVPGAGFFFKRVKEALTAGRDLADTFFTNVVSACADNSVRESQRFVFILDEYEILFARLELAAQRDRELRFTVVHPLLSQMVLFARENLIVLIGQQPDAHSILMDHNQLSPYVQQDPFPLFEHRTPNPSTSEFTQLVEKILTTQVSCPPELVDAIYAETGGHPFLTVNLLVSFFDWLMEKKYEWRRLRSLSREDFARFASDRLSPGYLSTSPEYNFFRDNVISNALSVKARSDTPWLHMVYRCLLQIATRSPREMMCTRSVFAQICERIGLRGMNPDQLLNTASSANFFAHDHSYVWPKVRILARLCAVARPPIEF